jgi:hypothetical protein
MLSCPRHGRRIETYKGLPPEYLRWTSATSDPPSPRDAVTTRVTSTWRRLRTPQDLDLDFDLNDQEHDVPGRA